MLPNISVHLRVVLLVAGSSPCLASQPYNLKIELPVTGYAA